MVVSRKTEEAVIRRLIEDWASAVRARGSLKGCVNE